MKPRRIIAGCGCVHNRGLRARSGRCTIGWLGNRRSRNGFLAAGAERCTEIMASGDAQRVWFPEMLDELERKWSSASAPPSHRRRSEEQVLSIRALPPRTGEEVLRESGAREGMGGDGQRRAKASPPEALLHSRVREGGERSFVQAVFLPGSSAETLGGPASGLRGSWSLQMLTAIA